MDLTVEECPYGQHYRFGAEFKPHLGDSTHHAIVLNNQIFNGLLEDHQIRLILQGRAYGLPIKHAIGLSASRPYGWAFAGV